MKTNLLSEMYTTFEISASVIKDWKNISKTALANGYCDYDEKGDDEMKEHFLAALMCRYWYMVPKLYELSKSTRLDVEDFVYWVYESLCIGLKYRRWRDPNYDVYYDKDGAEKVFHQCFTSTRQRYYKHINQEVRKINYTTTSLDAIYDSFGDSHTDVYEESCGLIDTSNEVNDSIEVCRSVVDYYLDKGMILEALIVDGICFQDTLKKIYVPQTVIKEGQEIEVTKSKEEFNARKLVKHLNHLDDEFTKYFLSHYKLEKNILLNFTQKIAKMRNEKLYNSIENTLNDIKYNEEVHSILCW
jgi:hypothetical protein